MVARRHHYVPRCYLKAFSVERKSKRQVQVFDKKTRKTFLTATENVALERDFNTVEAGELEPDVFEKAVASFEGELAPALERIIATQSLQQDADDYAILLNFVTLLALQKSSAERNDEGFSGASNEANNERSYINSGALGASGKESHRSRLSQGRRRHELYNDEKTR